MAEPPEHGLLFALEKLDEQLTCTVCKGQFRDPKILPCLHSFCLDCIKHTFVDLNRGYPDNLIRCPVCSKLTLLTSEGASGLPNAEHLRSFIDIKEQFFLPLSYELASASCTTHRREMKLYCSTCTAGICLTCAVHDHKQHEFRPISPSESVALDEDSWIMVDHPVAPFSSRREPPSRTTAIPPSPSSLKLNSLPTFQQYTYGPRPAPVAARPRRDTDNSDGIFQVILNEYDVVS